jgi:hypothetical protein
VSCFFLGSCKWSGCLAFVVAGTSGKGIFAGFSSENEGSLCFSE